jgi:hypothetical protein
MPVSYRFLTHAVQLDVEGFFTVNDIVQALNDITIDPQAVKGLELIVDLRTSDTKTVLTRQLRTGAERLAPLLRFFNNRIHLVVSTPVQYGLARMYQTHSSGFGIDVLLYKSLDEAYKNPREKGCSA